MLGVTCHTIVTTNTPHSRPHLQQRGLAVLLAAEAEAVPELAECFELVIPPPVATRAVLPHTLPVITLTVVTILAITLSVPAHVVHRVGDVSPGELDPRQHSDL